MKPDNTPIIVGVGQINDRPANPLEGRDPVALMADSLRQAEADAGATLLADADFLAVVRQIGFPQLGDVAALVAQAIGAAPRVSFQTDAPNGDSPVMLLNEAANRIGAGDCRVALVAGAEALRTAGALVTAKGEGPGADITRNAAHRKKLGYAQSYGLVAPTDVYPLYENAMRAALGQSLAEAQAESAAIWALMSQVAASNPAAWIRKPVSADDIMTPSETNRMIAFPYTKLMVANAAVNQGAAFIVTSVGEARRRGISEAKWIYVGHGAAAHEPDDILARDRFDRSASMAVSINRALDLNGWDAASLDRVELYSCFPCIPKLARRIIDWPIDKPITQFGGLTFGGGPIGNCMSHAIASMVDALRGSSDPQRGLLFANGGYATHNHTIAVSNAPIAGVDFPRGYDCQAPADIARDAAPPLDEGYSGAAVIETFTVHYRRDGSPRAGVVVARTPAGARTLAHIPPGDATAIAQLTGGEAQPVGMAGVIRSPDGERGLKHWRLR